MERELTLRIVLQGPPAGVDFGLQKGKGSSYETVLTQRSTTKDLHFKFTVGLKTSAKSPVPDFSGPLVQGTPGQRFVYVDISTYAGQKDTCWSRRLKVPLCGITWDMIHRLDGGSRSFLEARVPGTGKDGGPNCATVTPFDGWKPVH